MERIGEHGIIMACVAKREGNDDSDLWSFDWLVHLCYCTRGHGGSVVRGTSTQSGVCYYLFFQGREKWGKINCAHSCSQS